MKKFLLLLSLCSLAMIAGMPPETAVSYQVEDAPRWDSGDLTWYSMDANYRDEMRVVANVLDNSGANVSLHEAQTAEDAHILIDYPGAQHPCEGLATSRWRGSKRLQSKISWSECLPISKDARLIREANYGTIRLLVHEVLHAYGLAHQTKGCALMNSTFVEAYGSYIPKNCFPGRRVVGKSYCRYIEADDLNGLVALYGGEAKLPPQLNCPRTNPKPPSKYKYTRYQTGVNLSWSGGDAAAPLVGIWAVRKNGNRPCPLETDLGLNKSKVYGRNRKGAGSVPVKLPRRGSYCLFVASSLVNGYTGPAKRLVVKV